jgi:membrane dipeptidase
MYRVIDLLNGSKISESYAELALKNGISAVLITVNNFSTINPRPELRNSLTELEACRRLFRTLEQQVIIVESYADLEKAERAGKLGVIVGYQNVPGVERDLKLLELFWALGVRAIQIAHNVRNLYADGCSEPADAGLSALGRELVAQMNDLGMLIDISHVGNRSALDAIEVSRHPVAATHANPIAICPNARNKSDAVIDALARTGGLLGVTYLPPLVKAGVKPSHGDLAAMMKHVRDRVGSKVLAIGSDFITDQPGERYEEFMRRPDIYGTWPWRFPVEDPEDQQTFLASLREIGMSDDEISAVAAGNAAALLKTVWSN